MAAIAPRKRISIRSILRARLQEPEPRVGGFTDEELNLIIAYGEIDVASRLLKISRETFYKQDTLSVVGGVALIPDDLLDVVHIEWDGVTVRKINIADVDVLNNNDIYAPSITQIYYYRIGIHFKFLPLTGTGNSSHVMCYYVEKPTPLESDDEEVIIPEENLELLIKYCLMVCAPIIDKGDGKELKAEYDTSFTEIEEQYIKNQVVNFGLPGEEIPSLPSK